MKIEIDKNFGTRECPSCACEIKANNNRCPICGYDLPAHSPIHRTIKFWGALIALILIFIILFAWMF